MHSITLKIKAVSENSSVADVNLRALLFQPFYDFI